MLPQQDVGRHHVADGDKRKVVTVGFTRLRVGTCRSGSAVTGAQDVGANHKIAGSVKGQAFADKGAWIRPMGKVVYLTPAFTTPDADLEILLSAIRQVIGAGGVEGSGGV